MSTTAMRSVRWSFGLALLLLVAGPPAWGAESAKPPESGTAAGPVKMTAQEDHQNMMDLLGIKSLRRGADGMNRQSPYYQNNDEAKANPYPNLPDPLVLKNGQKVTTAQMWWDQRRPEIVEDFDREVYGRVPRDTPKVTWEVTETTKETDGDVPVITKQLVGHVDNSSYPAITVDIRLTLTTPANATGPVPVMMEFGFSFGPGGFGGRGGPRRGPGGGSAAELAAAGSGQGLGLCHHHPQQHSGRQRRRPDPGHHRPVQQGPAPQAG